MVVDANNRGGSFEVVRKKGALPLQPFALDAPPVTLRAKGRRIPKWTQEPNGMVGEVQPGPVRSSEPVEDITLVPMGSARLRISAFPRIGEGADAREWGEAPPLVFASSASQFETPPRVDWRDRRGSHEWVEYYYTRPRRVGSVEIRFTDEARGPRRAPDSWEVLYWDGRAWQPVSGAGNYEIRKDAVSRARFAPIETTRIRVRVRMQEGFGAGIEEMRVFE